MIQEREADSGKVHYANLNQHVQFSALCSCLASPPSLISFSLLTLVPSILPPPSPKLRGPTKAKNKIKKWRNYGATCILIGLDVEIDATVGVVLGVALLDMGGVFKSERGQDDKDDNERVEVLSNGGVKEVDDEGDIAVGVNVTGGGWENVVRSIPGAAEVDVEHHEFLLPFLFF